jgi:lipoprotein-releasing system ATP-binding protein
MNGHAQAQEILGYLGPGERVSHRVFGVLMQLVRATRVAMLIATRNMELAGRMDRRVTIQDGQIIDLP